ncbi:hypothetical protein [Rhodococcus sp. NPDC127528]|uniref:hypothetical protein n=1 Tax=unclassified Rhodococcus (in: high G+C Gram-positive bacteria) TaxID=192944 RepID=UPI00363F961A
MRKYVTPAVALAVASGAWIGYGAATGWGPVYISVAVVIWVSIIAIVVRQARRHA